jgi:cytochrome o ubiquinol oxidase subunit IV
MSSMQSKSLSKRVIGFVGSLVLTLTAFLIFLHPDFFHLEMKMNIVVVLILAVVQCSVQSIFFLHILSEKGPRWNLVIFASTVTIVLIIVVFSIWIMNHLNYRMELPLNHSTSMQAKF